MAGGYPLDIRGILIRTSEALYQACRFPHLPDVQRLIIEQMSPMTAKMKGKPHRENSRPDWDQVRVRVMRWCLRVKLAQNWTKFSELLLRTGDRPIVEESRRDDFWGAKLVDEQTLVGMNVLGRLLMELREAVKTQGHDAFCTIEPPDIPQFFLFGRPIGAIDATQAATAPAAGPAEHRPIQEQAEQASLFDVSSAREAPAPAYTAEPRFEKAPLGDIGPYAAMKDSGVSWLGALPEHWEVRKLRHVLKRRTERNRPDLPLLSVVREKGVILRDTTSADDNHNFIPDDLSNYKVVRAGQFAMNKMKAWQGSYGVSPHDGIVSPAYFVFDLADLEGPFFNTAIRSQAYVPSFTQASDGVRIGQWDLSETRMREIPILVPPRVEQATIVRFLNHADQRIRRYIRAKQKLVKLLEEQRRALIHHAVTRGLDPNVRLRPSGVEWLGDVPDHWEVSRAATVCTLLSTKAHEHFVEPDGEHICVTARFVSTEGRSFRRCTRNLSPARRGDVLMVMSDLPRGRALARSYLVQDDRSYAVNQRVCILRPVRVCPQFLAFATDRHPDLLAHDDGFNQTHLPNAAFKTMRLPLPPLDEQAAIADSLGRATSAIVTAVSRAQREIDLLGEYRSRLIADVVTGKLDVRHAAAQLPDIVQTSEPFDDPGPESETGESLSNEAQTEDAET